MGQIATHIFIFKKFGDKQERQLLLFAPLQLRHSVLQLVQTLAGLVSPY